MLMNIIYTRAHAHLSRVTFPGSIPGRCALTLLYAAEQSLKVVPDTVADEPPPMYMPPPCSGYTAHAWGSMDGCE